MALRRAPGDETIPKHLRISAVVLSVGDMDVLRVIRLALLTIGMSAVVLLSSILPSAAQKPEVDILINQAIIGIR